MIRPARPQDIDLIIGWRAERAQWLASLGQDQWGNAGLNADAFAARVAASIQAGETWISEKDGTPVGTIAVDNWTDPELWTPDEISTALFIHRLISPLSSAGLNVAGPLIDHAEGLAIQQSKAWLRLDAWTNNQFLHAFWIRQGFRHVRTYAQAASGALFERRVERS